MDAVGPIRRQEFELPEEWNGLTREIIACAMGVHTVLGPGLLERVHEDAMAVKLGLRGLGFQRQVPVRLRYKGVELSEQRIDLVVEGRVVVELKAVEAVPDTALAQLTSYLRAASIQLGLLINFDVARLKDGIYRRINSISPPGSPTPSPASSLRSSAASATSAFSPPG